MIHKPRIPWPWVLWLACFAAVPLWANTPLTLEGAVTLALENDPWLEGSEHRQRALALQGEAAEALPDPMVSLNAANLPTDTFDFDQEPMSQLKVGITQAFPRGETRRLKRKQFDILSNRQVPMRAERRAATQREVTTLWLDTYRNRESIRLIENDRALFEYLGDVAESSYRSTAGRIRQQDLVRAQLELTRLDDRLAMLRERAEIQWARLAAWLPTARGEVMDLAANLPELAEPPGLAGEVEEQRVRRMLARHPAIRSLERKIAATGTDVALARQAYKPRWSVNSSYAYRDDDPRGPERADFFSVGMSLELPLFSDRRQDKQLQAAVAEVEAVKTEKALALRELEAGYYAAERRLARLDQRRALYREQLLREVHDQAEASLSAYTSDEGDFAEVVRARIAELNAKIDFLNIEVDRLKTIAELNYLLTGAAPAAEEVTHE